MPKNELVLVTGGAGFIGSHLVDSLIKEDYRVRVLDNLAPPTHNGKLPEWFNKEAEFVLGDVRNKKDWLKALRGVNYVFHLAAYMDYHLDFSNYFATNTQGTALLYEIAVERKLPIKKIVIASSQSVYGEGKYFCQRHGIFYPEIRSEEQLKKKQWEIFCPLDKKAAKILPEKEDDYLLPQIPYGFSKLASEKLALMLGKTYKIPTVILRYSIVQGSRQSFRHFYSGALRDFSVRALAGLPMIIQEDANQIRDFVNVHDVTEAHLAVLKNLKADFQVFNVGSGKPVKVMDLARLVAKMAGVKFQPVIMGVFRVNAPRNSIMDITKLKKLGWQSRYSLKDSVQEYLIWIKNHPEAIKFWIKTYRTMERQNLIKK